MRKILGLFGSSHRDAEDEAQTFTDEPKIETPSSESNNETQVASMNVQAEIAAETTGNDPLDNLSETVTSIALADEETLGEPTQEVVDDQTRAVTELGERHELIAARLGQIGEILQQLNDAHKLVDRLAPPLTATFRHHQILAGQNIALQHALDHVNDEVSSLRESEVTATARSTSLELELRHLNDSYAQVQALHAQAEEDLRTASGEIRSRDASISDLERQVHELSIEINELRDDLSQSNERWQESAAVQNNLTQQLRQERENLETLHHEYESLKASLQQTVTEAAQLSRQKLEAEEIAAATRAHSMEVEENLASTQAEKAALFDKLNELELAIAEERRNLAVNAEGMRGRSETLEKLLTQAREELGTQADTLRDAQQKGAEMKNTIVRLETRCEKAIADLQKSEGESRHLAESNATLTDRVEALNKALQSKEEALQRNKEVLDNQAERLGALEGKSFSQAENYERQLASYAAALEQERAERALLEGTLEAARQEKQRLQRQFIQYRSTVVDQSTADVVQLANVTYPTIETLSGLVPKPSVEAPSIVAPTAPQTSTVKVGPRAPEAAARTEMKLSVDTTAGVSPRPQSEIADRTEVRSATHTGISPSETVVRMEPRSSVENHSEAEQSEATSSPNDKIVSS